MTGINPLPTNIQVKASHIVPADSSHHKKSASKAAFISSMMKFLYDGIKHMREAEKKANDQIKKVIEGKVL